MRSGVGIAARRLRGFVLHELDAGHIGIVDVEGPFAVAAYFGVIFRFEAVGAQARVAGLNFVDGEREMILYAALIVIGVGGDVEHVFDPVGALGDLDFPPVVVSVLEAAVPVHAEAEEVAVEAVFDGAVFDDEAGMQDAGADLFAGSVEEMRGGELHEGDGIVFGIAQLEMLDAVGIFGDGAGGYVMGEKVASHLFDVGSGEGDFGEEIVRSAAGDLEQFDLLVVVDGETREDRAHATGGASGHAENVAVELAGFVKVGGVEADVGDTGDGWARGLELRG